MPLPIHACPKRARRFCIIACTTAILFKAGPAIVGNFTFEVVGYAIDRTLP